MTTTTALTAADARRLTARIRDALAVADGLLVQMWRGRGWEALGYPAGADGWAAYCAAELPALQLLALRAPERREKIRALHREGMSLGAAAQALRISKATAHADVADMPDRPVTVTALDGRTRRASGTGRNLSRVPEGAPVQPLTAQLVALLAIRGPLTALELEQATGRRSASIAPALHRLATTGRIGYTAPARRGLAGLYTPGVTP